MRPLKLEIEGFNSFRELISVDFAPLDLFAITGPTGAGKTSLIDAIIFALYGRTPRIGEKSISELISQGSQRVRVFLHFTADKNHYRIARTLKRGGTTKVQLEIRNADGTNWDPISNRVSELRAKIEEIIGLDFDGFTKSVVLPQGEFDKFLRGERQERRHIISELLNLQLYVEMGQRARQKGDSKEGEGLLIEQHLSEAYRDVTEERKRELSDTLRTLRSESRGLAGQLKVLQDLQPVAASLQHLRQSHADSARDVQVIAKKLETAKQSATAAAAETDRHARQIKEIEKSLGLLGYDQAFHHNLLALIPLAEQRATLLVSITEEKKRHAAATKQAEGLRPKVIKAKNDLQNANSALEAAQQTAIKAKEAYASAKKQHGSLEAIRLAKEELQRFNELKAEREELDKQLHENDAELESIQKQLIAAVEEEKAAREEWKEAQDKLERMQQLHAVDELRRRLKKGEPCVVCEQLVLKVPKVGVHPALNQAKEAVEKAQARFEKLHDNAKRLSSRSELLPRQIQTVKKRLTKIEDSITELKSKLNRIIGKVEVSDPAKELDQLELKLAALDKRLEAAQQQHGLVAEQQRHAQEQYAGLDRKLALCDQSISSLESSMRQKEESLADLNGKLKESDDVSVLRKQLVAQEKAKNTKDQSEKELKSTEQLRIAAEQKAAIASADVSNQGKRVVELRDRVDKLQEQIEVAQTKIRKKLEIPKDMDETAEVERRRSLLEKQAQELSANIAVAESDIQRIEKGLIEAGTKRQQVSLLRQEASVYRELGTALRADQFIRFIEEEALQRLANDGSRHLLQLSSGRYSFSTEDDEFFAIDHWNADEPRSVNTLSGGESFLASLALALALGDTLAEFATDREHFSLDSLFLDEGFSTLDPETLDTAVQGIEALAGENRVIGVISHMAELAERFPVQIEVKKSVSGSRVQIVGAPERAASASAHA